MRTDGRQLNELRKVTITPNVSEFAEGSALVEFGKTKVLCTASLDESSPKWLTGTGKGWVTAEYGMLPRSTQSRIKRDKSMNSGRTQEISRLIGRSLRAAVNPFAIPDKQIIVDCDVIHADGGTRTAAITGGFVALALALKKLHSVSEIKDLGLIRYISAISVGIKEGKAFLDLNYEEDSVIGTDMNFVMTGSNDLIEVQGTAEGHPFKTTELSMALEVAQLGCSHLFAKQAEIIGNFFPQK